MQGVVDGLDIVQYVALGYEQIFPAIVVEILQANAPAGAARSKRAQTSFQASSAEQTRAVVVVKSVNLSRKHGHKDVRLAVVVVVLKHGAHAGERLTVRR